MAEAVETAFAVTGAEGALADAAEKHARPRVVKQGRLGRRPQPHKPRIPSWTVDEALHDAIFAVNEKGPFRMMAVFGPRMVAAGSGSIINVSSFGAEEIRHRFGAYSAAKAGLNALTIAFAQRLSPLVRVNTVSPGMFDTPMLGTSPRPKAGSDTPLGRAGRPEEIVTTVLYLASDYSSYTTGANIRVDGLGTPPLW
jgi:NAD(P)-dependent dehydrogenase (short-subunit alcohol dehydrogenase family)